MRYILAWLIFFSLFSGTIEKHSGKVLNDVRIHSVDAYLIKFSYPGEQAVQTLSVLAVKQVVFDSGRVQDFPLQRSVIVVNDANQTLGLIPISVEKGYSGWSSWNAEQGKDSAVRDLIRDAPLMGGNVILIESTVSYFSGSRAFGTIFAVKLNHFAAKAILEDRLSGKYQLKDDFEYRGSDPIIVTVGARKNQSDVRYIRATFSQAEEGNTFLLEESGKDKIFRPVQPESE